MKVIVMGVSGSGKTTIGESLATQLDGQYIDGDDLHPPENIQKMTAGTPLTDEDRYPWLCKIGHALREASGPIFIGSSALKKAYREIIRNQANAPVFFLHLDGSKALITARLNARKGHFWPAGLLDSQFAILEPLGPDENGITVSIDADIETIVSNSLNSLRNFANT